MRPFLGHGMVQRDSYLFGFREVWDGQYFNLLLGSREKAQEVKLLSQKMQN